MLFVLRFGSRKLGEGEGRLLKLMSGMMMLGLGGLMLHRADRPEQRRRSPSGCCWGRSSLTWLIHLVMPESAG
jgi:hypothetical protein